MAGVPGHGAWRCLVRRSLISLFVGEIYPVLDMHLEYVDADEYQITLDKHHKILRTNFFVGSHGAAPLSH